MPRSFHAVSCHCRACTGPDNTQRWVARRARPHPYRLHIAALGLLAVAALSLLLL